MPETSNEWKTHAHEDTIYLRLPPLRARNLPPNIRRLPTVQAIRAPVERREIPAKTIKVAKKRPIEVSIEQSKGPVAKILRKAKSTEVAPRNRELKLEEELLAEDMIWSQESLFENECQDAEILFSD